MADTGGDIHSWLSDAYWGTSPVAHICGNVNVEKIGGYLPIYWTLNECLHVSVLLEIAVIRRDLRSHFLNLLVLLNRIIVDGIKKCHTFNYSQWIKMFPNDDAVSRHLYTCLMLSYIFTERNSEVIFHAWAQSSATNIIVLFWVIMKYSLAFHKTSSVTQSVNIIQGLYQSVPRYITSLVSEVNTLLTGFIVNLSNCCRFLVSLADS